MKTKSLVSSLILAFALAGAATAAEMLPQVSGGKLVDANGMTLYAFDKDAQNKSNCNGGCAAAWPPAAAAPEAKAEGAFTIVTRDDGTRQWAHQGRPLYRFAGDAKAGDANGDNQGNAWHVIATRSAPQRSSAGAPMGYSY